MGTHSGVPVFLRFSLDEMGLLHYNVKKIWKFLSNRKEDFLWLRNLRLQACVWLTWRRN